MKRITVLALVIGVLAAALLVAPTPALAGEEEILFCTCFAPSDKETRFIEMGACDNAAALAGYKVGVLRPLTPNDPKVAVCPACIITPEKELQWACVGKVPI
jgi:hypothetical protein